MKEIRLNRGCIALVDDEDYDEMSKYTWHVRLGGSGAPYVSRSQKIGGKTRSFLMHRQLLGFPDGLDVHHVNHNTLDNRRENLEACTHKTNLSKRRKRDSITGITGVYYQRGVWRMNIQRYFDNPIDAEAAYKIGHDAITKAFPYD